MGDWVEVKIEGLNELQAKLEELPEKVAIKAEREAIRDGAEMVRDEFVTMAPLPEKYAQGKFKTILGHVRDKASWTIRTRKRTNDLAVSATVGPSQKILETRTSGKTKGLPRTAAFIVGRLEFGKYRYPFMTAAWESIKSRVLDRIIDSLKEALQ